MNRLSPLIVRRVGPLAPQVQWAQRPEPREQPSQLARDLQLFLTAWLGGLVFFGTFLS